MSLRLGALKYQISANGRKSGTWRLDFAKNAIAVEVAFNHRSDISWNLVKPTLSAELNHVPKAIQTDIGINLFARYVITISIILLTWLTVYIYRKYFAKSWEEFFGQRRTFWYGVVVAASVVSCVWAYGAGLPMPNLFNDYLD